MVKGERKSRGAVSFRIRNLSGLGARQGMPGNAEAKDCLLCSFSIITINKLLLT